MKGDIYAAGVIAVVGAVLLVLVFMSLDDGGRNIADDHRIQYGDYIEISEDGILGTDGPLEIVKIGEKTMLHANGLGVGAVVRDSGAEYFKVERAKALLAIMDGQSNAAYHNPNPSEAPCPEIGTAYYFGYPDRMPSGLTEDVSQCRIYDFTADGTTCRVGDKGPAFCKQLHENTGLKVVWISLGIPGHKLSEWNDGQPCWNQNLTVIKAALPQIPEGLDIVRTWIIWQQGESDYLTSTAPETYKAQFESFHDRAPGAWGIKDPEWLVMQGCPVNMGDINGALAESADALGCRLAPNLAAEFTELNGLMGGDALHYTQLGDNAIGAGAAWAIAAKQERAPVYLLQRVADVDIGGAVASAPATGYQIDGKTLLASVTWSGEADTSSYGTVTLTGTDVNGVLMDGATGPVEIVRIGYLGYYGGFELMKNTDSSACIIGRDSEAFGSVLAIPSEAAGLEITEIGEDALRRGPWRSIEIPDTVSSIGSHGLYSTPYVRTLTIGDGLDSLGPDAFQLTFIKNGETIPKAQWTADPSLIHGQWAWDGSTRATLYYQGE